MCAMCTIVHCAQGGTVHVRRVHCQCAQGALSMCAGCTVYVPKGALSMCAGCIVYVRGQGPGRHRLCAQGGTVYVHRGHFVEPPSIPTHHHHVHPYLLHNHRHMHKVDNVHVNSFPFPPLPFLPSPDSLRTLRHRPYDSAVAIHHFKSNLSIYLYRKKGEQGVDQGVSYVSWEVHV